MVLLIACSTIGSLIAFLIFELLKIKRNKDIKQYQQENKEYEENNL